MSSMLKIESEKEKKVMLRKRLLEARNLKAHGGVGLEGYNATKCHTSLVTGQISLDKVATFPIGSPNTHPGSCLFHAMWHVAHSSLPTKIPKTFPNRS